jgi:hypothetical protein
MCPRPQEVVIQHTGNRKAAGMFIVIAGNTGQRHTVQNNMNRQLNG